VSPALRIGTRGSALALAQARSVADTLGDGAQLVVIATGGDRGAPPVDKSRWVDAIEQALLENEVDLAVHSAKDVPGELAEGLALVGAPPRADARDALVGAASLGDLVPGARIGTGSLRRRAAVLAARPDVEVVELRGNVDTRLRKLAEGRADALVLAGAGLHRLGRADAVDGVLELGEMVPAPGQGTLALEARVGDEGAASAAQRIGDSATMACLRCERALVAGLGASCHTPVGAHARLDGDVLEAHAFAGLPDGSAWARDVLRGPARDPEGLGREVAERMLAAGARELLAQAEEGAAA
jgi:hydroxymethylbilane synthase